MDILIRFVGMHAVLRCASRAPPCRCCACKNKEYKDKYTATFKLPPNATGESKSAVEAQRVLNLDLRVAFTGLKIIRKFAAYLESEQKRVTLVPTLAITR